MARRFPHARLDGLAALKGDASTRRFWRVTLASATPSGGNPSDNARSDNDPPPSAIAIDLGPDDLPLYARTLKLLAEPLAEPPWLNLHRFLTAIGTPVPALYMADVRARMLLVEDVGDLPLFEAATRGHAGDLYRLAADALLTLHLDGTSRLDDRCIASRVAYDERLLRWELDQFVEFGARAAAPSADPAALAPELDRLAAHLGRLPRVLSHRDYHGHNLFVQTAPDGAPHLRMIDFQDALMAPAAQDLAVLLTTRDAARIITPVTERRVLDYYFAALIRRGAPAALAHDEFIASYRLCVLQHALKVIGRFVVLERGGKPGYAIYIPYAIAQARRALAELGDYPKLRAAFGA
ncbi:MAG TPA: phosphotransferase [Candidatus Binataceae bacterium]|nr:phosphotransferase [Candidatus Binataceae bacterium]